MGLRRRAFLGQACLLLAGLGVSEAGLSLAGSRYRQVLAQPTRRKLALLVGIDQYSVTGKGPALRGCLTDVELQRELLLHRFGFQASDVLVLTDQQATRHNIETAFMTHLVEQARPDDVIVFHYSGYGRHVRLGLAEDGTGTARGRKEQNALVLADSVLSMVSGVPTVNDLLEETLFLLLRSLPTAQVTTILDTSYTYPVTHGNLQIRTQPGFDSPEAQLAEAELAFQEHLLSQVDFSREQVAAQLRSRQLPGVILAAARAGQFAAEAHWQGFSAGLFTYGLTQQLWQTTPATTLRVSFTQAITTVQQLAGKGQQPELTGQKSRQRLSAYAPALGVGADGAVTAIAEDDRNITLWLAGLPVEVLEQYGANSILTLRPAPGQSRIPPDTTSPNPQATDPAEISVEATPATQLRRIQLSSVSGLSGKGRCLHQSTTQGVTVPVQVGQQVQEAIRVLPQTSLTIALDASLERIERVDATSAFSAMLQISSVEAGEPADYLFAKVTETPPLQVRPSDPWHRLVSDSSVSQSRYGLFFLGGSPISNTLGEVGEAIKAAVGRLTPKLQALLANKLLGLTTNENSSCLGISTTLETVAPQPQVLVRQQTSRAPWQSKVAASSPAKAEEGTLLTIPVGSRIRYRVQNYSDRPVYAVLLGLDSGVNAFAFYPVAAGNPEAKSLLRNELISPRETLVIPQVSGAFEWGIHGPTGLSTTYLILSREPLNQTLARLETVLRQNSDTQQIAALPNFLEVAQSVLQDLHQASVATHPAGLRNEIALDVNTWATLRFIYRVT